MVDSKLTKKALEAKLRGLGVSKRVIVKILSSVKPKEYGLTDSGYSASMEQYIIDRYEDKALGYVAYVEDGELYIPMDSWDSEEISTLLQLSGWGLLDVGMGGSYFQMESPEGYLVTLGR